MADGNINQFVSLNPYDEQLDKLRQRQRMAELLQQQAMQPLESQTAPGGYVVPTSPLLGLTKLLQSYMAGKAQRGVDTELSDLRNKAAEAQRAQEAATTSAEAGIAGRMFGEKYTPPAPAPAVDYDHQLGGTPMPSSLKVTPSARFMDRSIEEAGQRTLANAAELRNGNLEEITPTARYQYDPQSAFQMAMTPAGREAMKGNPMLAAALANMVKPKEPEEFYAPTETADGLVQFGKLGGKKVTGINAAPKSETLPTDYRLWQLSGSKLPFDQWDQQRRRAGAATTTVNTGNTYGSTVAQSLGKSDSALVDAARAAPTQIENATRIKNLLEQNPITGTGAEARLSLDRALSTAGLIDKNRTRATETLVSALAGSTLEAVKTSGLGAGQGFTDKDREFLERARSGNIEINAGTLRDLADLQEKAARLSIEKGNAVLRRWKKSGSFGPEFDLEEVAMPAIGGGLPPGATRDKP